MINSEIDSLPATIGAPSRFLVVQVMVNGNRSMIREQLKFGAWNIGTMWDREGELVEMREYQLEMLGVGEAKTRENGEKEIGDVRCVFRGTGRQSESRRGNTLA